MSAILFIRIGKLEQMMKKGAIIQVSAPNVKYMADLRQSKSITMINFMVVIHIVSAYYNVLSSLFVIVWGSVIDL